MTDFVAGSLPRFYPPEARRRGPPARSVGLAIAVLAHLAVLYVLVTVRTDIRTPPPPPLQVALAEPVKPPPPDLAPPPPPVSLAELPPPYIPPPEIVIQTPPPVAAPIQATTVKPAAPVTLVPVVPSAPVTPAPAVPAPVAAPVKVQPDLDTAHSSEPEYPPMSRRLREEGLVGLLVLIEPDGSVSDVKIEQSSGHDHLDQAAITAAKTKSRFKPGTIDGKPARMWFRYRYTFKLT